ncbi:MAG: DUF7144 family membrane protein [Candidatus Acidiferrales bacterium]
MISAGRWIVIGLFALGGLVQIFAGLAYLLGWVKPDPEVFAPPPGMEDVAVRLAGVISMVIGLLLLITAWGLHGWRRWARIVTIVLCAINLLGLVVLAFSAPLHMQAYISGAFTVAILLWIYHSGVTEAFAAGGRQP